MSKNVVLSSSLLIAAAAWVSFAADAPSLAGKWDIYTSIAGNDSNMVCTFDQKDAAVTGSCATEKGNVDITGKVDGGKITWSYKSDYQGMPLTVQYAGAMTSATRIKGTVDVSEFGVSGEFTANQAK
jgi:hypothetical protein